MDNNCKYANGGGCLCGACQSAREALQEAEAISAEEIDKLFQYAKKVFDEMKKQEEDDENG